MHAYFYSMILFVCSSFFGFRPLMSHGKKIQKTPRRNSPSTRLSATSSSNKKNSVLMNCPLNSLTE